MGRAVRRSALVVAATVAAGLIVVGGYLGAAALAGWLDDEDEVAELECDREGYPCSMHDVDPAAWARSESLLTQADDLREAGALRADIVAMLEQEPDVVEVSSSPTVVTFRVDGDQPVHLWTDLAGRLRDEVEDEHLAAGTPVPEVTLASYEPAGEPGAGNDVGGKQAIIIEPFDPLSSIWSGRDLAGQLRRAEQFATVDYIGRDALQFDMMLGLAAYDVIHISSHGWENGVIGQPARQYYDVEPDGSATLKDGVHIPDGVSRGTAHGQPVMGYPADFFRIHYPGGIPDALFVADWCRSSRDAPLAAAIAGPDTTFLGWTETVGMGFAGRSAARLWELLADARVAPSLALTQLADEGLDGYVESASLRARIESSFGCLSGSCWAARDHDVRWAQRGVDRRALDVVTSLDRDGSRIAAGTVLTWHGELEDGQRDRLEELTVLVEGVEHGTEGDVTVEMFIDDEEFPDALTLDEAVELPVGPRWSAWELTVERPELPFDVDEDRLRPAPLRWEVRVRDGEGYAAHVVEPVHLERPGIELKHPEHLARLDDGDVVEVDGYRNDGESDAVDIVFDVFGIDPDEIDEYEVVITVEGGTLHAPQKRRYRIADLRQFGERHFRLRERWELDEDLSSDNDELMIDAVLVRNDERFEHGATVTLDGEEFTGCFFEIAWSGSFEATTERFDDGGGTNEGPLSGGGDPEFRQETEWMSIGGSDRQEGAMALVPPVRVGSESTEYGLHMNALPDWGSPPQQGPGYLWTLNLGGVVPPGETGSFTVPYRPEEPRSGMELMIEESGSFEGAVDVDLDVNDTFMSDALGQTLHTRALKGEFSADWGGEGRSIRVEGSFQYRPEDCAPELP